MQNACNFFWNFDDVLINFAGELHGWSFDVTTGIGTHASNSPNEDPMHRANNTNNLPTFRRVLASDTGSSDKYYVDFRCGDSMIYRDSATGRYSLKIMLTNEVTHYVETTLHCALTVSVIGDRELVAGEYLATVNLPDYLEMSDAQVIYTLYNETGVNSLTVTVDFSHYTYPA